MYERKPLTVQQVFNPVQIRLALPSQKQCMYAEFEGNKDDIIDILIAFGVTMFLLSVAVAIFRG